MPNEKIRRALISVSDKTGLVEFAKALDRHKVEIISTGGTLKTLQEAGINARAIDDLTGFPEMLDGRVKTLHPKVHGGLLFRRGHKQHVSQVKKHGIEPIDLVVVNLYPFEKVTSKKSVSLETAIENIDIGGPSMLRSAAKNADSVTVVCDISDYEAVIRYMEAGNGCVPVSFKRELALKVFARTAAYDRAIAEFLEGRLAGKKSASAKTLPEVYSVNYKKVRDLRYGENPHQRAGLYVPSGAKVPRHMNQLHGKELSYNNLLDIEAAVDIVREFTGPGACVVKHSNPCGAATAASLGRALTDAIDCDPMSAFGGIVAMNEKCGLSAARKIFDKLPFFEVVIAPAFEKEALEWMKKRKNLRIIETGKLRSGAGLELRQLKSGALLIQDEDPIVIKNPESYRKGLKTPTKKKPTAADLKNLMFAFQCVKTVKSNAIVLTQQTKTVGIGAGQMSRVDAVEIACRKAGKLTKGACLASDAFFPMPDSIDVAHKYGIRSIIQPGGSIRDDKVIEACDRYGISMVLTGKRHFKH